MGHLERDARTVAGALVRADAASVLELAQSGQGLFDDLVVGRSAVADDECEAAVVVFERRIVETDAARRGRGLGGRLNAVVHILPSRC